MSRKWYPHRKKGKTSKYQKYANDVCFIVTDAGKPIITKATFEALGKPHNIAFRYDGSGILGLVKMDDPSDPEYPNGCAVIRNKNTATTKIFHMNVTSVAKEYRLAKNAVYKNVFFEDDILCVTIDDFEPLRLKAV